MKFLNTLIGRLAGIASWPLMAIYLRGSNRTRLIVRHKDEILLVRGWVGNGSWSLPGGGLHKNEDRSVGAVRELYEETGIDVNPANLTYIGQLNHKSHMANFVLHNFYVVLKNKPKTRKQFGEISEIRWFKWRQVYSFDGTKPYIKDLLKALFIDKV